jgi:hypothetical protein
LQQELSLPVSNQDARFEQPLEVKTPPEKPQAQRNVAWNGLNAGGSATSGWRRGLSRRRLAFAVVSVSFDFVPP